jgi:hypothetical protein
MKISYSPAAAIHQGSFLRHFLYLAVISSHLKPLCQCSAVCIQLQFAVRVISGPPGAEVIKSQIRNDATPVIAVWSGGLATIARPLLPYTTGNISVLQQPSIFWQSRVMRVAECCDVAHCCPPYPETLSRVRNLTTLSAIATRAHLTWDEFIFRLRTEPACYTLREPYLCFRSSKPTYTYRPAQLSHIP